jgi:hypothetical protein
MIYIIYKPPSYILHTTYYILGLTAHSRRRDLRKSETGIRNPFSATFVRMHTKTKKRCGKRGLGILDFGFRFPEGSNVQEWAVCDARTWWLKYTKRVSAVKKRPAIYVKGDLLYFKRDLPYVKRGRICVKRGQLFVKRGLYLSKPEGWRPSATGVLL